MLPLSYRPPVNSGAAQSLTSDGIHPVLAECLVRRGVVDASVAKLQQKILHYSQLKGMRETALGLARAIIDKEKMVVVADYDCDGATACAIAVSGLKALGADIDFVVPDRLVHGYGLTPSVVHVAREKNPLHIVTVDNGIASVDGVNEALKFGLKVWVTDHHLPGPVLPNATGVVNPNQPDCPFPSKNLAGCGVMFYVLWATRDALKSLGHHVEMDINAWLDLVALGTVADVVKLDDNNRWLVQQGLLRIRKGMMRPGIHALFEVSRRDWTHATSSDFGFSLGPRLNAAGRLSDMSIGIRCLLSENDDEATSLAQELCVLNEERKDIESIMKSQALEQNDLQKKEGRFTRVVVGDDFHEGVIGIVAGRIKELEYVPTIVFAPAANEEGLLKGSGRSIPSVHLRDALDLVYKKNPEWFVKFGGHAMAAGLTIYKEFLKNFHQEFEKVVKSILEEKLPSQTLMSDGAFPWDKMDIHLARTLTQSVWGQGFEEPVWVGDFRILSTTRIGPEKNHLSLQVEPLDGQGCSQSEFKALHFFGTENVPSEQSVVTMAYRVQHSVFRGRESIDIMVVDR